MYYCLNDNVYIVKGKSKDCIYDLDKKKLYHIQKELSNLISRICSVDKDNLNLICDESKAVESLLNAELICTTDEMHKLSDIKSLVEDFSIKFAWIEVCTYCNLKCLHCYNESSSQCHETMSFEKFKFVCQELIDIGIKEVQLIGGEPFCHKNIREMLLYASEHFEFVEIFTNGTLINDEWCQLLRENNIRVALSVYSYIASEHDKVTLQEGSHKKTSHTISLLNSYGITYRACTVHMKDILVGEKNTDLFTIHPFKDVVRLSGRGNLNLLTPELLKYKLITKETFSYALNPENITCHVNGNRCFSSKLYISANLEVYPCVMERRFSHGNLNGNKLKKLIKREIQQFSKDKVESCNECEFRYACYDCRPDSISDNIYAKPYYCTYDVDNGIWLDEDTVNRRILSSDAE